MASEILAVPEERVLEVIKVLRAGLHQVEVSEDTRNGIESWCEEYEEYYKVSTTEETQ